MDELTKDNKQFMILYELFFYLAEGVFQIENPIEANKMDVINVQFVIYVMLLIKNNDNNFGLFRRNFKLIWFVY